MPEEKNEPAHWYIEVFISRGLIQATCIPISRIRDRTINRRPQEAKPGALAEEVGAEVHVFRSLPVAHCKEHSEYNDSEVQTREHGEDACIAVKVCAGMYDVQA